jgi:hypothetical protein
MGMRGEVYVVLDYHTCKKKICEPDKIHLREGYNPHDEKENKRTNKNPNGD